MNSQKKQSKPILVDQDTFQLVNQYKADHNKKNKSEAIKHAIKQAKLHLP